MNNTSNSIMMKNGQQKGRGLAEGVRHGQLQHLLFICQVEVIERDACSAPAEPRHGNRG